MQDEAFHEIQLNGKQLVFLFMAATVVAVVIFLCGVMVGRGVQTQLAAAATDAPLQVAVDPTAPRVHPAPATTATTTTSAPVTAQETLTYTARLEAPTPPVETLKTPEEPVAAPPPPVAAARAPERAVAAGTASTLGEPPGNGFVVQVAAVNERDEADAIARRLSTRGYPAFVTTPGGAARVFRVRVGKYDSRREAESVAGRLEREEQFKPWITR
jgi:septal ring-binding cell division protein DamX